MNSRAVVIVGTLLLGCGSRNHPGVVMSPPPEGPTAGAAAPAPTPVAPVAKPRPVIGDWGFDLAGMDRSVVPGADFYRYANGGWLASTAIPDDRSSVSVFSALTDQSDERSRQIIESATGAPGSDGQRIGDYYRTFMAEDAIEARGIAPIHDELDRIAAIKDAAGVALELAAAARRFENSPVRVHVIVDIRDPDHHIPVVYQGGLGLSDRDMYDVKAKQFAGQRAAYQKYIATMFGLIGWKDAERRAAAVYALEQRLAQAHWTAVQSRDPQKTYNRRTLAELAKQAPGLDWTQWLPAVGLDGQAAVMVMQPSAIAAMSRLVRSQPVAVWRDYLTLQRLTASAPYLPRRFVDAHFEMFSKALWGTPRIKERQRRAIDEVLERMGDAVARIYVAKYFPPETKAAAEALVENLRRALARRIDGLTWMSPETRAEAKAKLAACGVDIGYPATWHDYAALTITAGDAIGNARRAGELEYRRLLAKLGTRADHEDWWMTPMTVDAYASGAVIVFPAGILQPPFFDPDADAAINYGAIGAYIGHELSHHFDDRGAQFDAKGALRNWWTPDDARRFKAATDKLVAQYGTYCPIPAGDGRPAQCVNGALTLSENVADLVGVTIAYDAYQLSLGGQAPPVLDGLTGEQRFFLGWAQIWRNRQREQQVANRLATDPHSPPVFRVDTVRNLDAWYSAFRPAASDALYLAPDQRVRIW